MIKNSVILICAVLALSACGNKTKQIDRQIVEKPAQVVVQTVEVKRPKPIVPKTDNITMRDVQWVVFSKENAHERLEDGKAYYALDTTGYQNISKNLSDVRMVIQQKDAVINTYEGYFER